MFKNQNITVKQLSMTHLGAIKKVINLKSEFCVCFVQTIGGRTDQFNGPHDGMFFYSTKEMEEVVLIAFVLK